MKTKMMYLVTKVTVAVILVALLAVEALAGEAPKLKLLPHSNDRAVIVLDNETETTSELAIEDLGGNVLYYKEGRISEKMHKKLFDFSNLEDGAYRIIATNSYGKEELKFNVVNGEVSIIEKPISANSPYIEVDDDVLKLSFLNRSLNEIYLTIESEDGAVYSKSLGNNFSITTGFDLKKLRYGTYSATLTDGENTYSYNFDK